MVMGVSLHAGGLPILNHVGEKRIIPQHYRIIVKAMSAAPGLCLLPRVAEAFMRYFFIVSVFMGEFLVRFGPAQAVAIGVEIQREPMQVRTSMVDNPVWPASIALLAPRD
jgi:hypothetical protein